MALLLPAVQSARQNASATQCKNNLSNLGKAYKRLAATGPSATGGISAVWVGKLLKYAGDESQVFICPNDERDTSDGFVEPIPSTVVFNQHEDSDKVVMWLEQSNYSLPQALPTDLPGPGNYSTYNAGGGPTIPANTQVDVYYLHFDPVGSQNSYVYDQDFFFSGNILGVICHTNSLASSDSIVGALGVSYPTNQNARGYENGAEIVTLTESSFTVDQWHSTFPGEQTRLITEPGASATTSYGFNNQARSMRRVGRPSGAAG